jgi:hypothetical protein
MGCRRYSEPISPRTWSRFHTYPRWNPGSAKCPESMKSRMVEILGIGSPVVVEAARYTRTVRLR